MTEQTLTKTSRKRRIAAFLIDHFVMTFLIVSMVLLTAGPNFTGENNMGIVILLVFLLGFFIYFAKDSRNGISIGKWVMGIMIRDENDFDIIPSFGRLLKRNLLIVIWPVEFIVLAANNKKQRLGDQISKTVVLKNPNESKKQSRVLVLLAIVFGLFMFTVVVASTSMKNSEAYKVAIQNIENDKEIINETGGITGYGMIPTGSVNISNGHGQAQLEIKVLGKNKNITVNTYLEKEPNRQWKLIEMHE